MDYDNTDFEIVSAPNDFYDTKVTDDVTIKFFQLSKFPNKHGYHYIREYIIESSMTPNSAFFTYNIINVIDKQLITKYFKKFVKILSTVVTSIQGW